MIPTYQQFLNESKILSKNLDRMTPDELDRLLLTVYKNHKVNVPQKIELIIRYGANPDVQDISSGRTALHHAARNGNLEACKLLIAAGARLDILSKFKYSVRDLAIINNNQYIVEYLESLARED